MLVSDAHFQAIGWCEGSTDLCDGHQEPGGRAEGYWPNPAVVPRQNPRVQTEERVSWSNFDLPAKPA